MLKRMTPAAVEDCLAAAAASPCSDPTVVYPTWYLQRWHFLPAGYLSPGSARAYDRIVRRVYSLGLERRVVGALSALLGWQAPRSLVDLGCGTGRLLSALAAELPGAELTGLDLSPFMLEVARPRLAANMSVELIHGDACKLPWTEARFEAATAVHLLGHLPAEASAVAGGEVVRVLRPGGRLYVVDHAWHPRPGLALPTASSRPLLGGLLRLTVFEKD